MIDEKQTTHLSKFLSLVLRHKPETIGITLDENGWTDLDTLIEKCNNAGKALTKEIVFHIVDTNPKKRFALNETKDRIRANQGHSVEVDLGYTEQLPPAILYHGTSQNVVTEILAAGLEKRQRHHVHLSVDTETAIKVGQRHGKPVVFEVLAKEMSDQGYAFYVSDNGVWLTDNVPAKFLKLR